MSIDWRLKVYDATFTDRTQPGVANNIITSSMGVASLDTFDVDAAGGCLEASFRAVPAFVDIQPRDVIILEISTDSGSTWTPKYRGYVVTCGNPRSKSIQPYKLVGLKQRFYEKILQFKIIDGDDVATMVNDVFDELVSESDLPSGVTTTGEDIPILSFAQGDRYPQLETAGETFDALVETVGAFVVPTGSSYTYDGVTYSAGDTVPAVIWGVDAEGTFFFRRPQAASVTIDELDVQTSVLYNEITAETVANRVVLVYATTMTLGIFQGGTTKIQRDGTPTGTTVFYDGIDPFEFRPLFQSFDFGSGEAAVVKVVDAPQLIMANVADTVTGTASNLSNMIDGNESTFASFATGQTALITSSTYDQRDGFVLRVRFSGTSAGPSYIGIEGDSKSFEFDNLFDLSNDVIDLYLPVLNPLIDDSPTRDEFQIAGGNLDVYDAEILVPDNLVGGTLSEEYANGFVRQPTLDVATIRQVGTLGDVTQTIDFTPDGESARDVPVERISYALTTREGLVTTYHAGQAYDAELLSERAVLEALAKRATR